MSSSVRFRSQYARHTMYVGKSQTMVQFDNGMFTTDDAELITELKKRPEFAAKVIFIDAPSVPAAKTEKQEGEGEKSTSNESGKSNGKHKGK